MQVWRLLNPSCRQSVSTCYSPLLFRGGRSACLDLFAFVQAHLLLRLCCSPCSLLAWQPSPCGCASWQCGPPQEACSGPGSFFWLCAKHAQSFQLLVCCCVTIVCVLFWPGCRCHTRVLSPGSGADCCWVETTTCPLRQHRQLRHSRRIVVVHLCSAVCVGRRPVPVFVCACGLWLLGPEPGAHVWCECSALRELQAVAPCPSLELCLEHQLSLPCTQQCHGDMMSVHGNRSPAAPLCKQNITQATADGHSTQHRPRPLVAPSTAQRDGSPACLLLTWQALGGALAEFNVFVQSPGGWEQNWKRKTPLKYQSQAGTPSGLTHQFAHATATCFHSSQATTTT